MDTDAVKVVSPAVITAMNNRTIRSSGTRNIQSPTSSAIATSPEMEPAALASANSPENGSSSQWWKLDEDGVSSWLTAGAASGVAGAAGSASWESSLKSDLIDCKALFRVKWQFN